MNVDKIYVITLEDQNDRQELIRTWFPKVPFEFYKVNKMKNPKKGCFSSHKRLIDMAKKKNYKRILILEDDAFPCYPWEKIKNETNKCIEYLDNNIPNWKYLMLGQLPIRTKKINSYLVQVICSFLSHAYVVNLKNVTVPSYNKSQTQIDIFMFCGSKKNDSKDNLFENKDIGVYGTNPILIKQKSEKSTIQDSHLIHKNFIEFFGGDDKIVELSTKCNTFTLLFLIVLLLIFIPLIAGLSCGYCYNKVSCNLLIGFIVLFIVLSILIGSYQCYEEFNIKN